jgi:hypothetical protein
MSCSLCDNVALFSEKCIYHYDEFLYQTPTILPEISSYHILNPDTSQYITLNVNLPSPYSKFKTVRTGVIGDGSCLFHSILYILNFEKYIKLSYSERMKVASNLRNAICEKVDIIHWYKINNGLTAEISWLEMLIPKLQKYENLINNYFQKYENNNNLSKIFSSLFIHELATLLNNTDNSQSIDSYKELLNLTKQQAFDKYKYTLSHNYHWGNSDDIQIIEQIFQLNILIIDSNRNLVCNKSKYPYIASMFLYNQGNQEHWEPIGLYLDEVKKQTMIFKF